MRLFVFIFFYSLVKLSYSADNFFVKNKGQFHKNVVAKSNFPSGALFLEERGLTYNFINSKHQGHYNFDTSNVINGHSFSWIFDKSQKPKIIFKKKIQGKVHYFKEKHITNLSRFQEVLYQSIYPKIDYKIYSYCDSYKYDFVIHPQGNPKNIKLKLEGIEDVNIINGKLLIKTRFNEIIEEPPYAYQIINNKIVQVDCEFILKKNILSFNFPKGYNKKKKLIVDPVLIFSSYSGSYANNFGYTATYDDYGFLYSGGTTFNIGYPTTPGAYSETYNNSVSGTDIVLSKYDTTGTFLIFSTYLGGSQDEVPHSLVVYENELFMMGTSGSNDFPTTQGCFDNTFNGGTNISVSGVGINYNNGCDIVLSRFSSDGSQLLSSTYIGGSMNDGFNTVVDLSYNYADQMRGEIDFDKEGNCYISSCTQSNDFPVVNSVIQPLLQGNQDGIILKIDKNFSNLIWSTFLGGSNNDAIYSMAFDKNDDIFVCGGTKSINFPTTSNAYQPDYIGGSTDAFITKINKNGSSVINSTFFGSEKYDQAYFIDLDKNNSTYIYGQTLAPDSTLIFNANFSELNSGQFIAKFNYNLSNLDFSTVFGSGSGIIDISPTAFLVDVCNRIYCSGWGGSTNALHGGPGGNTGGLTTTSNAFQTTTDSSDFYLIIIEDNANSLSYATFFGGSQSSEHVDGGTSRFDRKGIVYQSVCAGCGGFSDFPTTPNAVSSVNNSSCNNAVFKFDPEFNLSIANFSAPEFTCSKTISFINLSHGSNQYLWSFGDGSFSNDKSPTYSYKNPGVYNVTLFTSDSSSCNLADTITKVITIQENENNILDTLSICTGDSLFIEFPLKEDYSYTLNSQTNYSLSINNTFIQPIDSTEFILIGNYKDCIDTIIQHVTVNDLDFNVSSEQEICSQPLTLFISTNDSYDISWSSEEEFSILSNDSVKVFYPGEYFLEVSKYGCKKKDTIIVGLTDDCCTEKNFSIPNAFSPNGDNINDYYKIKEKDNISLIDYFELKIFNRWGEKVFESNDEKNSWDGTFKSKKLNIDVFDFYLNIGCIGGNSFFKKGNITLIK